MLMSKIVLMLLSPQHPNYQHLSPLMFFLHIKSQSLIVVSNVNMCIVPIVANRQESKSSHKGRPKLHFSTLMSAKSGISYPDLEPANKL